MDELPTIYTARPDGSAFGQVTRTGDADAALATDGTSDIDTSHQHQAGERCLRYWKHERTLHLLRPRR